jgi:GNAT superfamily N-acetyltransferase
MTETMVRRGPDARGVWVDRHVGLGHCRLAIIDLVGDKVAEHLNAIWGTCRSSASKRLHRNRGCGAALLQHGLRQCDREHRPAYLCSSNPLNISLYQRHGFEIVGTIQVGSSPSIFPTLRHAR